MSRSVAAAFLVIELLLAGAWAVSAQDSGDGAQVPVMAAPTFISVPEGEPLVLWVRSAGDKFASAVVLVEKRGGTYQQLTPCDNIEIICHDVEIPSEGTQEGDTFFLASE